MDDEYIWRERSEAAQESIRWNSCGSSMFNWICRRPNKLRVAVSDYKRCNLGNLSYAYKEIRNNYLNGADSKALIDGATEGMVASLEDPYSVYLSGDKGEQYMQSYEDHFVG